MKHKHYHITECDGSDQVDSDPWASFVVMLWFVGIGFIIWAIFSVICWMRGM